ncbi:hypothetical protein BDV95DRAFT_600907 [Massariosphaeria phaeospora]|uniref:Uncharacterized protein n=1 Tax=Massariosphaeria phaeospora TaxID=100035 RepID=A0A7C8MH80_9PLEO|nr:hypothetical protein BDV95DRAFT_600907 [Massariosphaeria phaeospora]
MSAQDYHIQDELEMCSKDNAPVYPKKSVIRNCALKIDLSKVPKNKFEKVTKSGRTYLKLDYRLLIRVEGAQMVFSFDCGGKEYGRIEADFGT